MDETKYGSAKGYWMQFMFGDLANIELLNRFDGFTSS